MKKIYFLLFCFLFTGNVFASSYSLSDMNYKELQETLEKVFSTKDFERILNYFKNAKSKIKITDERIEHVTYVRKKDPKNDNALNLCSVIYYCSDNEIREILEEELGKDDLSIRIARYVL